MEGLPLHVPVLPGQVLRLLDPARGGVYVDCTVGTGGHAELILEACGPRGRLVGIDLDEDNLLQAKERLSVFGERVRLFQANFADLPEVLAEAGVEKADGILADLGVARVHLEDPRRGFSFLQDGPLDMRLDRRSRRTAADLVNSMDEKELADLIYNFGQERYSRRIARAIVTARRQHRIERTLELARLVASAVPPAARRARRGVHPATRCFQALRIAVNDELANLDRLLSALPGALAVGGRAAVISFHSLEDRRVKRAFADWSKGGWAKLLTAKPIAPTRQEVADNPRSRSAKLRGVERIA